MHQLAAVRGLRETQPPTVGMVNVLRRGMEDATIFCRVRGEAAMALAVGAGTEHNGEHPQPSFTRRHLRLRAFAQWKYTVWTARMCAMAS